jgi:hypothetical protein
MASEEHEPEGEHAKEKEKTDPAEQKQRAAAEKAWTPEARPEIRLGEFGAIGQQPCSVALGPAEPDQAEPGGGQQAEQKDCDQRGC